ncbi:MAG: hypothetical protein NT133_09220 [Alphaproteobacteria bacterium]|nr:hypothetical protein [Alphaproteobacteria bacterium]
MRLLAGLHMGGAEQIAHHDETVAAVLGDLGAVEQRDVLAGGDIHGGVLRAGFAQHGAL